MPAAQRNNRVTAPRAVLAADKEGGGMIQRAAAALIMAASAVALGSSAAGAAPFDNAKKAFEVECSGGSLAGETLTIIDGGGAGNIYWGETHLRLISFKGTFGDETFEKEYGKKQEADHTCTGSVTDQEGTFTFEVALVEVP